MRTDNFELCKIIDFKKFEKEAGKGPNFEKSKSQVSI
jgi:hypothetical protein